MDGPADAAFRTVRDESNSGSAAPHFISRLASRRIRESVISGTVFEIPGATCEAISLGRPVHAVERAAVDHHSLLLCRRVVPAPCIGCQVRKHGAKCGAGDLRVGGGGAEG